MSEQKVKCPNCGSVFPIDELLSHQAEEKYRLAFEEKMKAQQHVFATQEKEFASKQAAFEEKRLKAQEEYLQKLEQDRERIKKEEQEKTSKLIREEFELKLKNQEDELSARKRENELLKQKELDFLKKQEALLEKEKEIELHIQRQLNKERERLAEKISKQEQDKNDQKLKELQFKLEQQVKLAEEFKRKAEQGSMQIQGEIQELELEAILKEAFPFDHIDEVGKGVKGADCIQTVRNQFGQICGKIIYESKKTQNFANDWIEKLKIDLRAQQADIAVIVTQVMPKDMSQFGEKNGVWICSFVEVKALAFILRHSLIKVSAALKSQENKGDKMQVLYDYLTGNEFGEQWKAIREGFLGLKISIQKERDAMEKLWKAREVQLQKILLNATHISGSIEGISGLENVDIHLLDE